MVMAVDYRLSAISYRSGPGLEISRQGGRARDKTNTPD